MLFIVVLNVNLNKLILFQFYDKNMYQYLFVNGERYVYRLKCDENFFDVLKLIIFKLSYYILLMFFLI